MRFRYTILYVEDVRRSLDFYRRAFGIDTRMLHESGMYGELATGDTRLAFSSRELMKTLGKSPSRADARSPVFEVAFEVDDVASAYANAIAAGAAPISAPADMPWGQTIAYVADQDGVLVEICTAVG